MRPASALRAWWPPALAGLAALAVILLPSPPPSSPPVSRTVRIEAGDFSFDPAVVTVQRGDRVTLELVALDVVHGLHLDAYGVEITADPGQTARATFVADRAGTFTIRCAVPCGPLHPFMIGRLRVDPSDNLLRVAGLALLAAAFGGLTARARRGARAPTSSAPA